MVNGLIFSLKVSIHQGFKRWLLGQGEAVTVLSPRILVEDIKQTVQEMIDKYR